MNKNNALMLALGGTAGLFLWRRARERFSFRDKVVLIVGGSRGLGLWLARELAADRADIALCARDPEELKAAARELEGQGSEILTLPCDATDREEVRRTVKDVLSYFGRVDVVINNLGIIQVGPHETMTLDDYEQAMKTHFWAPLYFIEALLPELRRRRGRIVNISSIGGKMSVPHLLPYTASKFALTGFSEGLGAELEKDGVIVTTVCPGLMRTGSYVNALFKGKHQKEYRWFATTSVAPLLSMDARRAARKILEAVRRGDREVVLSLPAKIAARFYGAFPDFTVRLMGLVSRFLPAPGGIGTASASGRDSAPRKAA